MCEKTSENQTFFVWISDILISWIILDIKLFFLIHTIKNDIAFLSQDLCLKTKHPKFERFRSDFERSSAQTGIKVELKSIV